MDLMDIVSKAAPLIGGLLTAGPLGAGAVAIKMLASEFGTEPEPDKIQAAIAADPNAAVKLRKLELDNKENLTRMSLEAATAEQAEINKTMRAETAASDPYVRRWRPTIGYVVAFQFGLLGIAILAATIGALFAGSPEITAAIFDGMSRLVSSMLLIIGAECAVLGVSVVKRSHDKAVASGQSTGGSMLASLLKK